MEKEMAGYSGRPVLEALEARVLLSGSAFLEHFDEWPDGDWDRAGWTLGLTKFMADADHADCEPHPEEGGSWLMLTHERDAMSPLEYTGADVYTVEAGGGPVLRFGNGKYRARIEAPPEDGLVTGFFTYFETTGGFVHEIDVEIVHCSVPGQPGVRQYGVQFGTYRDWEAVHGYGESTNRGIFPTDAPYLWAPDGFDPTDPHVYGFDWHPDTVYFLVDGAVVGTVENFEGLSPVPTESGGIHVNLWAPESGDWSHELPEGSTSAYVDWISFEPDDHSDYRDDGATPLADDDGIWTGAGQIDAAGDKDVFRFEAASEERVVVKLTGQSGHEAVLYTDLGVVGDPLEEVALNAVREGSSPWIWEFITRGDYRYYVEITGGEGDLYELEVERTPIVIWESASGAFVDDFDYASTADGEFASNWLDPGTEYEWGGPSVDVQNGNLVLAASVTADQTQATSGLYSRMQFEGPGAYAARVKFGDKAESVVAADGNVQAFYAIHPVHNSDQAYSEVDFEYLTNKGWNAGETGEFLQVNTWDRKATPFSDSVQLPFTVSNTDLSQHHETDVVPGLDDEWVVLVFQVAADGSVTFFINTDNPIQEAHYDVDHSMEIAFSNWFAHVESNAAARTYEMLVDWVLWSPDPTLTPSGAEDLIGVTRDQAYEKINSVVVNATDEYLLSSIAQTDWPVVQVDVGDYIFFEGQAWRANDEVRLGVVDPLLQESQWVQVTAGADGIFVYPERFGDPGHTVSVAGDYLYMFDTGQKVLISARDYESVYGADYEVYGVDLGGYVPWDEIPDGGPQWVYVQAVQQWNSGQASCEWGPEQEEGRVMYSQAAEDRFHTDLAQKDTFDLFVYGYETVVCGAGIAAGVGTAGAGAPVAVMACAPLAAHVGRDIALDVVDVYEYDKGRLTHPEAEYLRAGSEFGYGITSFVSFSGGSAPSLVPLDGLLTANTFLDGNAHLVSASLKSSAQGAPAGVGAVAAAPPAATEYLQVVLEDAIWGEITLNIVARGDRPPAGYPVADAGANQVVVDQDNNGYETVTLDGSGSSDDGTITSYVWTENGSELAVGEVVAVNLSVGEHTILLTVTDDGGHRSTDTVVITVGERPNHEPEAAEVAIETQQAREVWIDLDAEDPDDDPLTYVVASLPSHGELFNEQGQELTSPIPPGRYPLAGGSNRVRYEPADGFWGDDAFLFWADDGIGAHSNSATVSISVLQYNYPPTAFDVSAAAIAGQTTRITLDAVDANPDELTYRITGLPSEGQLRDAGNGQVISAPGYTLVNHGDQVDYTPDGGYLGEDRFYYRAYDEADTSHNQAKVTITVREANHAPTAYDQAYVVTSGEDRYLGMMATDPDWEDHNDLTFTVLALPAHGQLINPGPVPDVTIVSAPYTLPHNDSELIYRPEPGFTGTVTFTYKVRDLAGAESAVATITLTIGPAEVVETWPVDLIDDEGSCLGTYMAQTPDGRPAMSYILSVGPRQLRYAEYNSGSGQWDIEIVDAVSGINERFTSLAFGPDGQPAIAYRVEGEPYGQPPVGLFYAWRDVSGVWQHQQVEEGWGTGQGVCLRFNPVTGLPAIAFADRGDETRGEFDHIEFAEFDGSDWGIQVADDQTESEYTDRVTFEFDTYGNPNLAYYCPEVDIRGIRGAYRDSSGVWSTQMIQMGHSLRRPESVNFGNNRFGLTYVDDYSDVDHGSTYEGIVYMEFHRVGPWHWGPAYGISPGRMDRKSLSLAVAPQTIAGYAEEAQPAVTFIEYRDGSGEDLKYCTRRGGAWHTTLVSTSITNYGYSALGFGEDGYPLVAVRDTSVPGDSALRVASPRTTIQLGVSDPSAGTVLVDPDQAYYGGSDTVMLTPSAAPGWGFSHWSGDVPDESLTDNPLVLAMNRPRSVTAHFEEAYTLTATVDPAGGGSIVRLPDKSAFAPGETVSLTARPDEGALFLGWSGDVPAGHEMDVNLELTMDGDRQVVASFDPIPELSASIAGQAFTIVPGGAISVPLVISSVSPYDGFAWVTAENVPPVLDVDIVPNGGYIEFDGAIAITASGDLVPGQYDITLHVEAERVSQDFSITVVCPELLPGDANGDDRVDHWDFGLLIANFGTMRDATWAMCDFNGDGGVDLRDFAIVRSNLGTSGAGDNLILNGDFEDHSYSGSYAEYLPAGSTGLAHWSVDFGSVDLYYDASLATPPTSPLNGSSSWLDMNGDHLGTISQAFATTPGAGYQVTFDLGGNPDPFYPPAIKTLRVSAAGQSAQFTCDTEHTDWNWASHSWSFTAGSDTTTLSFASLSGFGFGLDRAGPALDNVVVEYVSEPDDPGGAPTAGLSVTASAAEPIAAAAAPVVPVVSQPLDVRGAENTRNANDDSIAAAASAPAIDLLAELPSAVGYISGPQPLSAGSSAATLYREATGEYDLRPLGDDPATDGEGDLVADILAESALAVPL